MHLPLAKFDPGETRDGHGRWTGADLQIPSVQRALFAAGSKILAAAPAVAEGATGNGPQPKPARIEIGPNEHRSLIRSSLAARASKTLIPKSYTGSETPEREVDAWKSLEIRPQIPAAIPVEQHIARMSVLKSIIRTVRDPAIEHAKITRQLVAVHGIKDFFQLKRRTGPLILDPATPRGAANRAFNHAAMLSLHDRGVLDYNFKMSDAQKEELTPLIPFMRYVRRRLKDDFSIADKGGRAPYLAAFGSKFPKPKFRDDGTERTRVRPNDEFVKFAPSRIHEADLPGIKLIGGDWPHLRLPLAKFEADKHPRDDDGKWSTGAKVGLAAGLVPGAALGLLYATKPARAAYAGVRGIERMAQEAGVAGRGVQAFRHFSRHPLHAFPHLLDLIKRPVAEGKIATGKQLRRQFLRDSMNGRERHVVTDGSGRVLGQSVGPRGAGYVHLSPAVDLPNARRDYHNHPFDSPPSPGDVDNAKRSDETRWQKDQTPLSRYIYGHGTTAKGRTITRVTRYDSNPDKAPFRSDDPKWSPQLSEPEWRSAAVGGRSNYRTKAVEKLAPSLPLAKYDIGTKLARLQARRDPGGIEARKAGPGHLLTEAEVRAAARSAQVPTSGQVEAGNYQKGHLRIGGLPIAIETPRGRFRRGVGPTGRPWAVKMPAHYGYVKGTEGADGDHVDVYLGPQAHEAQTLPVFVVDQVNARSRAFDEHKCLLGFPDRSAAIAAYDAAFSDGLGPKRRGAVCRMTFPEFRGWLRAGDTKKPLALPAA